MAAARVLNRYVPGALLFVALVLVYAFIGSGGSGPGAGAGPPAARTPVSVQRVVDGDTIVVTGTRTLGAVDAQDGKLDVETVRLIGVDTPESVGRYKGHPQCYGLEASSYMHRLLPDGAAVILSFDAGTTTAQMRDRTPSHRLLAYVWLSDNRTMVNQRLVREGYAKVLSINPQDDYRQLFKTVQDKAKREGKGRWGACPT